MYKIYLDGTLLPVAPSKIQTKIKNKNEAIELINENEVNLLKAPGLTEIEFDILLPQVNYPFAVYEGGFVGADYFLGKFEKLKVEKKSFRLIISRISPSGKLLFDTNMVVSLEDYEMGEDAKEGLDIVAKVSLRQFIPYGTKTLEVVSHAPKEKPVVKVTNQRTTDKQPPRTYIVQRGDSLWNICKKQLGDGSKYSSIAKLNGITNPNKLSVGQVIRFG